MKKNTCCASVWSNLFHRTCGNTAKVERDGKWYCGIHDPVVIATKNKAKNEKWDEDKRKRSDEIDARVEEKLETQRKADCYDQMLAALIEAQSAMSNIGMQDHLIDYQGCRLAGEKVASAIAAATKL